MKPEGTPSLPRRSPGSRRPREKVARRAIVQPATFIANGTMARLRPDHCRPIREVAPGREGRVDFRRPMKRSSLEREGAPARLFTLDEAHGVVCDIEPLVAEIKSLFSRIRREIAETSEATGIPAGNDRISQHLEARGLA